MNYSIENQIKLFEKGTQYIKILKPATINDGIVKLTPNEMNHYKNVFHGLKSNLSFIKFVPASGAASRMFKKLLSFFNEAEIHSLKQLEEKIHEDSNYKYIYKFLIQLPDFAFFSDLEIALNKNGHKYESLIKSNQIKVLLEYVLFDIGLGLSVKPKGVIKFHSYPNYEKTPVEEQVFEASEYSPSSEGKPNIHLTISEEHKTLFEEIEKEINNTINAEISYSYQKKETDTIAVDLDNNPCKDENGEIVHRPGGHGALLENLNELDEDIIYIQNVDNVVHERLSTLKLNYKKILAGFLIEIREKIFTYMNKLSDVNNLEYNFEEIESFIENDLRIELGLAYHSKNENSKINLLKTILNRPIRVCGMVKNEGQPGGGPFWTINKLGKISLQIVESSQIDLSNSEQKNLFETSSHFNPVDIVCSIKNSKNEKFNLVDYRDDDTCFISHKSLNGKEIKALELPGLWNGAMSDWITIFIEVPAETFTPVKEVNDLLKAAHQPGK